MHTHNAILYHWIPWPNRGMKSCGQPISLDVKRRDRVQFTFKGLLRWERVDPLPQLYNGYTAFLLVFHGALRWCVVVCFKFRQVFRKFIKLWRWLVLCQNSMLYAHCFSQGFTEKHVFLIALRSSNYFFSFLSLGEDWSSS